MYRRFFKRLLDILLSLCILVLLSPVYVILIVLVRIKLGSPVFFRQERPGLNGEIFTLYKFRTMTDARDKDGKLLPDKDRLTSFGKFLRSSSLDELPEFFNILKGDMSFIGPRPLLVSYLPYYTERESLRHTVRPGLTGLAQVSGRNFIDWDRRLAKDVEYVLVSYLPYYTERESLRHTVRPGLTGLAQVSGRNFIDWDRRLAKDVEYVEGLSFLMDLKVLFLSVKVVLCRSDVAEDTNQSEGNFAQIRKERLERTGKLEA